MLMPNSYVHRGMEARDHSQDRGPSGETEVRSVTFEDGLLTIDLAKIVQSITKKGLSINPD